MIDQVPGTAFLADFYHLARMGEDIPALIRDHADRFGHVQIADVPGRGQPGTGELDYPSLLRQLADSPYQGPVGLEYKPVGPSDGEFRLVGGYAVTKIGFIGLGIMGGPDGVEPARGGVRGHRVRRGAGGAGTAGGRGRHGRR